MSTALQVNNLDIIEQLVVDGDISKLTQEQRLRYYYATCERLGLDPMSQPLGYLKLNGKTVLYAYKGATDQIAGKRSISRRIVKTDILNNKVYLVVAEASDASGRVEQSTGAISIENLGGENLVNALLKAETKAKRRAVPHSPALACSTKPKRTAFRAPCSSVKSNPARSRRPIITQHPPPLPNWPPSSTTAPPNRSGSARSPP
jgi:hypothetical protein